MSWVNHISFWTNPAIQAAANIAGATGVGHVTGGQRGATIGFVASTFFTLARPPVIARTVWRTGNLLRIGAPLAAGGRSVFSVAPLRTVLTGGAQKAGGLGASSATAGDARGAMSAVAGVGFAESQGWVEEGTTDDLADLYLSVVGLGDRSTLGALADWSGVGEDRVGVLDLPELLLIAPDSQRAVPNNAAGIPAGTVISTTTGRPRTWGEENPHSPFNPFTGEENPHYTGHW